MRPLCAKQNGLATARYIQNFKITDQETLIAIAKLYAKQDGEGRAQFIPNFEITDEKALREISVPCILQNPHSLLQLPSQIFSSCRAIFEMDFGWRTWDQTLAFAVLDKYIAENLPRGGFRDIIPYLRDIKDPHAQQQLTVLVTAALFALRTMLTDDQLIHVDKHHLMNAIFSVRAPHLFLTVVGGLIRFYSNPGAVERFNRQATFDQPAMVLICMFLSQSAEEETLLSRFASSIIKLSQDGPKARLLLSILCGLQDSSLTPQQRQAVLEKAFTLPDTHKALQDVVIILDLGEGDSLQDLSEDLEILSFKAINKMIPFKDSPEGVSKIFETFGASRNPQAIWVYASKMRQLKDPRIMECLGSFLSSVADGSFLKLRYDLDRNLHLRQLGPVIVDSWKRGIILDSVHRSEAGPFDAYQWLYTKLIVDKHMELSELGHLQHYLTSGRESIGDAQNSLAADIKKPDPTPSLILQRACLSLARASTPQAQLISLRQVQQALGYFNQDSEFMNDVRGQIQLMASCNNDDQAYTTTIPMILATSSYAEPMSQEVAKELIAIHFSIKAF